MLIPQALGSDKFRGTARGFETEGRRRRYLLESQISNGKTSSSASFASRPKSAKCSCMNLHRKRFAGWPLWSLVLLTGCSSSDHAPAGPQDISEVIYVGGTTDEALLRLLDATAKDDPQRLLNLDSPDLAAPVAKDSPATFQFHALSPSTRAPDLRPRQVPQSSRWAHAWHEFVDLVSPERIAHAHGAAFNGTAYYLVFSDADSKQKLQLFTSDTSYLPEANAWQSLATAPQPLTLDITWASFEANDIPQDSGPFVGGKFQFRIE